MSARFVRISAHLLIALIVLSLHPASFADEAGKLRESARAEFNRSDADKAREHLTNLLDLYRAEHVSDPSWHGEYQFSRRLADSANELLAVSASDSMHFRLHRTSHASDAPVGINGVSLFTQVGGIGRARVVWKEFQIRADRIMYVRHSWRCLSC